MRYDLSNFNSDCEERASIISCKDIGQCIYKANNTAGRNRVRHYKIDGKIICDNTIEKCDDLVLNDDKKDAYFIELKGSDIHKAIRQLENTRRLLLNSLKEYQQYYRIVYRTSTQAVCDSRVTRWKEKNGKKKGRKVVIIKQLLLEEKIS